MPVFFYFYNMKEESAYKCYIDKNEFKALSFVEADNHYGYWKNKSMKERLDTACYIIQQVYGTANSTSLDRTVFSKRKHS